MKNKGRCIMNPSRDNIVQEFRNSIRKVNLYLNCTTEQEPIIENQWSTKQVISYLTTKDRFVLKKRLPYMMKSVTFPECSDFQGFNKAMMRDLEDQTVQDICREFMLIRKMLVRQILHISEKEWLRKIHLETFEFTFQEYFEFMIEQEKPHFQAIDEFLLVK